MSPEAWKSKQPIRPHDHAPPGAQMADRTDWGAGRCGEDSNKLASMRHNPATTLKEQL